MNRLESFPVLLEGVTKRFQQGQTTIEALKRINLTIRRGEFVAVMGASGSGKSTLLHVMAGLTSPDEGSIFIDDKDLASFTDRQLTFFRRRHIGLIFQAFNLIPTLTAEENILLPLLADGRNSPDGTLDKLLERLALSPRRRHRPDALSGGEQQRVAIARALAAEPSIILADEPTGSLDSVSGQAFCRLLRELCDEQTRTIVLVTHEPAVAVWADRIVVLKDGKNLTEFKTADYPNAHDLAARYQDVVKMTAVAEVQ